MSEIERNGPQASQSGKDVESSADPVSRTANESPKGRAASFVRERLLEGVVIGVVAGVILGLINVLAAGYRQGTAQGEQLEHLRSIAVTWRPEFWKVRVAEGGASVDRIRALVFKDIESAVRDALERRSPQVLYDKLIKIERAFSDVKKREDFGPVTGEGIACEELGPSKVDIALYEEAFRKLEAALGLPGADAESGNRGSPSRENEANTPRVDCNLRLPVPVRLR